MTKKLSPRFFLWPCLAALMFSTLGCQVLGFDSDRRTPGMKREDQDIVQAAYKKIHLNFGLRGHINILSYNRRILITGEVPTENDRLMVEQIVVGSSENIRPPIINELVAGPDSSNSERAKDSYLTARVKSALIKETRLIASSLVVVSEAKTVYLLGRVTEVEGQCAREVAMRVEGIKRLVLLFDFISDGATIREIDDAALMRDIANAGNPRPCGVAAVPSKGTAGQTQSSQPQPVTPASPTPTKPSQPVAAASAPVKTVQPAAPAAKSNASEDEDSGVIVKPLPAR